MLHAMICICTTYWLILCLLAMQVFALLWLEIYNGIQHKNQCHKRLRTWLTILYYPTIIFYLKNRVFIHFCHVLNYINLGCRGMLVYFIIVTLSDLGNIVGLVVRHERHEQVRGAIIIMIIQHYVIFSLHVCTTIIFFQYVFVQIC